jgi:hypothetical protein
MVVVDDDYLRFIPAVTTPVYPVRSISYKYHFRDTPGHYLEIMKALGVDQPTVRVPNPYAGIAVMSDRTFLTWRDLATGKMFMKVECEDAPQELPKDTYVDSRQNRLQIFHPGQHRLDSSFPIMSIDYEYISNTEAYARHVALFNIIHNGLLRRELPILSSSL